MAKKKTALQISAEYFVARALLITLRRLPLPAAEALANTAAKGLDAALPKLRRVARKNLSFAFPEQQPAQREAIIDGVFRSVARLLLTMARLPDFDSRNIHQWIRYDGLENYLAAKAKGKGVLVATGHLGNWELSAYAHALLTDPMHVMVRPLDNPKIDALVEQRRTASGNRLIYKKDAARAVLKALRENGAVGILTDQNTAASEGVFVNFFNHYACANSAFVKLAYHSGAAVIPGFALWDEGTRQYVLRFYREVCLSGDLHADTQRVHSFLESVIAQHPDQWMWIHRRWKTRPDGEPPLY